MWSILRSISDTLGVGFLIMQLIKLIGMVWTLVGPLKFFSGLFAGLFPLIAHFFKVNFGWSVNGLDVMAVSIAVSGTLIVASSVATQGAMTTKYFWRFLLIPYAFLVITIAIVVQIATPVAELMMFSDTCEVESADASFYGSTCEEMAPQLRMLGSEVPADGTVVSTVEGAVAGTIDGAVEEPDGLMAADAPESSGIAFWLTLGYLIGLLPLIAVVIFFFKRLSVNKLLKRVAVAAGSALGLVAVSAVFAAVFGA